MIPLWRTMSRQDIHYYLHMYCRSHHRGWMGRCRGCHSQGSPCTRKALTSFHKREQEMDSLYCRNPISHQRVPHCCQPGGQLLINCNSIMFSKQCLWWYLRGAPRSSCTYSNWTRNTCIVSFSLVGEGKHTWIERVWSRKCFTHAIARSRHRSLGIINCN